MGRSRSRPPLEGIAAPPVRDPNIPDAQFYAPLFSPWNGYGDFAHYYRQTLGKTLVSPDRCHVLYQVALQSLGVTGDFWECGVYQGGTAALLAEVIRKKDASKAKHLCLFDTFEGMPATDSEKDLHRRGDFAEQTQDW